MISADWFGGRLRELREAAGLTQKDVADRAGVKTNTIARLERGEQVPNWPTVVALIQALDVACDEFLKPPQATEKLAPGRPPKAKEESTEKAKKPRGRPRKK